MVARIAKELRAGTEGLSRQMRYKVLNFRLGNCINCGDPREDSPFKRFCTKCGRVRRAQNRASRGNKAWRAGRPGRPPLKLSPASPNAKNGGAK